MTAISKVAPYHIHGFTAPGFELVREKFVENFETKGEIGAAVCVYHQGEKVVDLWGGFRDKKRLMPWKDDTMIIVWGSEDDVKTAVNEVIIRAKEATIGIPSETRQAMSDGTNGFERILPGADRMYPDTDLPPKKITKEKIEQIKSWLPEQFWKRIEWYIKLGIPKDTIEELSVSIYAELFKKAVNDWKINPTTVAVFLIQYPKRLKKRGVTTEWLNENKLEEILKSYADKKIPQDALLTTLQTVAELGMFTEEVIQNPASKKEVDEIIFTAKSDCDKMTIYNPNSKSILLMGMIMKKLRGRISAKVVADRIGFLNK